jgi:hypothetical protein
MLACPLEAQFPFIASLLPNPPAGSAFFLFDEQSGTFVQDLFDGAEWEDPQMAMHAGTAGLFYNPGEDFTWTIRGGMATTPDPAIQQLHVGQNLLSLSSPRAGLITKVLPGFTFKAGDSVQRMTAENGTYQTYSFDGIAWDVLPVINIGEAIFLTLVER